MLNEMVGHLGLLSTDLRQSAIKNVTWLHKKHALNQVQHDQHSFGWQLPAYHGLQLGHKKFKNPKTIHNSLFLDSLLY